jgi:hypothetical protein
MRSVLVGTLNEACDNQTTDTHVCVQLPQKTKEWDPDMGAGRGDNNTLTPSTGYCTKCGYKRETAMSSAEYVGAKYGIKYPMKHQAGCLRA